MKRLFFLIFVVTLILGAICSPLYSGVGDKNTGSATVVIDGLANVTVTTSGPVTVSGLSGYYVNNASGALTFNLPVTATGKQYCFRNAANRTGAITIAVTANQYIDRDGALGTVSTGTLVSSGALGDCACVVGQDATHWLAIIQKGTWTNN
jgi:hypothetical protein